MSQSPSEPWWISCPETTQGLNPWEQRTIPGVFIGYHIHAGGFWSGDYLVADFAPFRQDCDVVKGEDPSHQRGGEDHSGKFIFQSPYCDRRGSSSTQIWESLLTYPTWSTRATTTLPGGLAAAPTVWFPRKRGHSPHNPLFRHLHPQRLYSHRRTRRLCLEPTQEG